MLLALRQRLSTASPATLAMIHAEINATVAAAGNIAQQAQAALGGSSSDVALNLSAASQASRAAVASFNEAYYEKKIFDPYLRFSSAEDEERYRRDEAKRKEEIEKAMALHTPQGDLKANTLALDQLKDAGAHGADQSPEYAPMIQKMSATRANLESAISPSASPAATRDSDLAAATDQSGVAAARGKIDPATLAAFGSLVPTDKSTPPGPGVGLQAKGPTTTVTGLG